MNPQYILLPNDAVTFQIKREAGEEGVRVIKSLRYIACDTAYTAPVFNVGTRRNGFFIKVLVSVGVRFLMHMGGSQWFCVSVCVCEVRGERCPCSRSQRDFEQDDDYETCRLRVTLKLALTSLQCFR